MSIEKFYTTTLLVSRMEWSNDSGGNVEQGSFAGHIQQARPEYVKAIGEKMGQIYLVWCAIATDVQSGDKITVEEGQYAGVYTVRNIQENGIGNNQHLELTLALTRE